MCHQWCKRTKDGEKILLLFTETGHHGSYSIEYLTCFFFADIY